MISSTFHWAVIGLGAVISLWLLRRRWPGWVGLPLIVVIVLMIRDAGLGPLANDWLHVRSSDPLIPQSTGTAATQGAKLILYSYGALAIGMILARIIGRLRISRSPDLSPKAAPAPSEVPIVRRGLRPSQVRLGRQVSMLFFAIGFLAQIAVIGFLFSRRGLVAIALDRAAFTDEVALSNPVFHYARTISRLMQFGSIGLIVFARTSLARRIGIASGIIVAVNEALLGGRARVIYAALATFLAYYYGARRIRRPTAMKALFAIISIVVILLGFIAFARLQAESSNEAANFILRDIITSDRLDQAAFAYRVFPELFPFRGMQNVLITLGSALPSISLPGVQTFYSFLVDAFFGGVSAIGGIGGYNYATSAETYSWGGVAAVMAFGVGAGLLLGSIFEWQRRRPDDPFAVVFAIIAAVTVLTAQSRMPDSIGDLSVALVAIALMKALVLSSGRAFWLLIALAGEVFVIVGYFVTGLNFLRILIVAMLVLLYILSIRVLAQRLGPTKESSPPPPVPTYVDA